MGHDHDLLLDLREACIWTSIIQGQSAKSGEDRGFAHPWWWRISFHPRLPSPLLRQPAHRLTVTTLRLRSHGHAIRQSAIQRRRKQWLIRRHVMEGHACNLPSAYRRIDHQDIDRGFLHLELQPEPLLDCVNSPGAASTSAFCLSVVVDGCPLNSESAGVKSS